MAKRPILALPKPSKVRPKPGRPPREGVGPVSPERQAERLGPKFDRLSRTVPAPANLAELRSDPAAIVPERALVFEVASKMVDFHLAMRAIGLEFLGEDETDRAPDSDFSLKDDLKLEKRLPLRVYFTMPDAQALQQLASLWHRWQRGEALPRGKKSWAKVFAHLSDLRPWGPKDRLTSEVLADWEDRLRRAPGEMVRFEVEFFFRAEPGERRRAETSFLAVLQQLGGIFVTRSELEDIAYQAVLVDAPASQIQALTSHSSVDLALHEDVMFFRPQSLVGAPVEPDIAATATSTGQPRESSVGPPITALLDGLPMAGHAVLEGHLEIDDPEDFAARYGSAQELRHATAMASVILNGNLDAPTPVSARLHVRPVMYPRAVDLDGRREERMPADELAVDLIWRSIIRMKEGEGDADPTAPTVRIINLSLGNANQRFARLMSPWARLIDYVAWRYRMLLIVSAGNVLDAISLAEIASWTALEDASAADRERHVLSSVLGNAAQRTLLSPAESLNALTIGSCHDDSSPVVETGAMAVVAYANRSLPNPSSAMGLGYQGSVKPDLLFPGGREHLRFIRGGPPVEVEPSANASRFSGIKAASPGNRRELRNIHGTSPAAALATNAALRIIETLRTPAGGTELAVDEEFYAVILKALLVHGGRWDADAEELLKQLVNPEGKKLPWQHVRDALTRVLGYGRPDIERVLDCAEGRATLLGWGTLRDGEADRYRVPLPEGLQGISGFRAVTATVGWLTPANPGHRAYRLAKLEAIAGADRNLSLGVTGASCQPASYAAARGTVFHHRWEGTDAVPFVDEGDLVLDVCCKAAAGTKLEADIPYGVAVTIEVGQDVSVPIYDQIRARLRTAARVGVRAR